jgi:hypothetical protein
MRAAIAAQSIRQDVATMPVASPFPTSRGQHILFVDHTAWVTSAGPSHNANGAEHRFSVQVDSDLPEGAPAEAQAAAREAATELLALPWELLYDGRGWLFQGKHAVRVRRRMPNRQAQPARPIALPIRPRRRSRTPLRRRSRAATAAGAVVGALISLSRAAPVQAASRRPAAYEVGLKGGSRAWMPSGAVWGDVFDSQGDPGILSRRVRGRWANGTATVENS